MNDDDPRYDPSDDLGDPPRKLEDHLTARATWTRLLFMIVLVILYGIAGIVAAAVVVLQFCYVLFTGRSNERLVEAGGSLATYSYEVIRYLTYNSDSRPFPFDLDWPKPEAPPD